MDVAEYTVNKKKLIAQMENGSVAVINSNDILPTNADGTLKFRQNNDLYWLTGINQEETTLVLFPDHPEDKFREILFIKRVDEYFIKWYGRKLTFDEATDISGVKQIYWVNDFKKIFYPMSVLAKHIYLNSNEHPRSVNKVQTRDDRFAVWCQKKFRLHSYKRLAPILGSLRRMKSEAELSLIKKACDISEAGFRRILKFVAPGVKEKEIQAELIHEYMHQGGECADYIPIVASGVDSCILHYTSNHKKCEAGEVLLIDAAASYNYYNADLTRTIPISGRFTERQKQVYNAVLQVHKAIKQYVKPGMFMKDIDNYAKELLIEQLIGLKLFTIGELKFI